MKNFGIWNLFTFCCSTFSKRN